MNSDTNKEQWTTSVKIDRDGHQCVRCGALESELWLAPPGSGIVKNEIRRHWRVNSELVCANCILNSPLNLH
jgi:hypothetical protein